MGKVFKRYKREDETPTPTPASAEIKQINPTPTPRPKSPEQPKKDSDDTTKISGFVGLAKNLTNSLLAWQKAGRPVVTSDQWNTRISICRGCVHWQELGTTNIARCKKCGCSSGKLLLATSKCPLNPPKWGSV